MLDGVGQPVAAQGMPRLDPFRADPGHNSYRSGFWGIVELEPKRTGGYELSLRAELDGGRVATAALATVGQRATAQPITPAWPERAEGPRVAIAMATHNPPTDLFKRQLESIRDQTHRNWVCFVSDDCSDPARFQTIHEAIGDDPHFVLDRSPRRLGFYGNFERALSMVPPSAAYVALADQDDAWHPDKLAVLLAEIRDAELVYSDARIVARDGQLISPTYWSQRRNNHADLLSVLVANSVTGAASLMRGDLLDEALPFPPGQFAHYHDHWLALTALARGEIRFVDRPLYDYVQHGAASLGHATANQMPTLRGRLSSLGTRSPSDRVRKWRMHYFVDIARLLQFATVLEMRFGPKMTRGKRRTIERFLRAEDSTLLQVALVRRGVRELLGRPETLGAEWMLLCALVWRRLLGISAREHPQRRFRLDAVPPPSLAPGPDRVGLLQGSAPRAIADKIAPLALAVSDTAPRRINLLIPTIDLEHLFAGYIAKFNLARRLAERGVRVRVVTVDPTPSLPRGWERRLESYSGLSGLTDLVEIAFGRKSVIEASGADGFIATTWWTAHIARQALAEIGGRHFLYLIQEYEPFTFPMGSHAALARQSYDLPHFALFSTELLRDYFRSHRIGVYASGVHAGDASSLAFENAITVVDPPPATELAARRPRRLLFYARPEPHAARNMFELGVLALSRAVEDGVFRSGWELHGVGTVQAERPVALAADARLELLPRMAQAEYARVLRDHDVGLALMYTPHPSLVPIEMASAGMLTVTNSFENKTPAAMAAISSNLITAEPSIEAIADALGEAAAGVDDSARRIAGSTVRWSRDWNRSFDDRVLSRIAAFLDP